MAIKEVDHVPWKDKDKIWHRLLRDYDEAYDNGITRFELVGYDDIHYLNEYARQVGKAWLEQRMIEPLKEEQLRRGWERPIPLYIPKKGDPHFIRFERTYDENGKLHMLVEFSEEGKQWLIDKSAYDEEISRQWRIAEGAFEDE